MIKAGIAAATLLVATMFGPSPVRADDSLNSRVCHNISLSERDRAACERDIDAARTEEDRTKIRKQYEAKIVEARSKKTSHAQ